MEIDIRLAFAQEVASQIDADILPEYCKAIINDEGTICGFPLVEKRRQCIPFCWFCVTDKMAAQRGRTALMKAKLAAKGIIISEDLHPHPAASANRIEPAVKVNPRNPCRIADPEEEQSFWSEGMTL